MRRGSFSCSAVTGAGRCPPVSSTGRSPKRNASAAVSRRRSPRAAPAAVPSSLRCGVTGPLNASSTRKAPSIAQALRPDGKLVIDFLNVHYAEDHLIHKHEEQIDGVNYYITKWFDETHFYKKVIVEDESLSEPLEFMEKVAKFSLGDFNDMFSFHQLQIQEVFGDYEFGNYDVKKSPRMIMVAQKKPH